MIIQTLKSGDHIVTMDDLYGGELIYPNTIASQLASYYTIYIAIPLISFFCFILGTNNYFKEVIAEFGIVASFVDCTNLSALEEDIQSNTKVNFFAATHRGHSCSY